jgi:hypothetical protein
MYKKRRGLFYVRKGHFYLTQQGQIALVVALVLLGAVLLGVLMIQQF